jgi:CrcB protein
VAGERAETTHPEPLGPAEAITEAELPLAPADRPVALRVGWSRLSPYAAVSAGAVLGAESRYVVGAQVAARWPGTFPWGTLLINLTGSLVLGFFITLIAKRFREPAYVRLFLATGLLGAYTTFSTFSVETVTLVQHGHSLLALAYVVVSLLGGYSAARGGVELALRAFSQTE